MPSPLAVVPYNFIQKRYDFNALLKRLIYLDYLDMHNLTKTEEGTLLGLSEKSKRRINFHSKSTYLTARCNQMSELVCACAVSRVQHSAVVYQINASSMLDSYALFSLNFLPCFEINMPYT